MMAKPSSMEEFSLKPTNPKIGGNHRSVRSTFDLVEPMDYLYIRIVKARDLYGGETHPDYDPYVEVRLGNYGAFTNHFEKNPNPVWNHVFAFSKDHIHSPVVKIFVRSKVLEGDEVKGLVQLDVLEAPKRLAPDSPLAPQWYRLEGLNGGFVNGELMLAVWMGTQADEAFTEAWHSDAPGVGVLGLMNSKSKVYMSPKLWYLRVNVIQVRDLEVKDKTKKPEVFVRAVFGGMMSRTKICISKDNNPLWNEDLMFVVAEPFENQLILTVEEKVENKDEVIGQCMIQLGSLEKRLGDKPVDCRWHNLERPVVGVPEGENGTNNVRILISKLQLRASLDGGYHVLDETTKNSSDLRPTVRQLWRQGIGVLELGILNATGLPPMKKIDDHKRTDAYCVAKYGQKWVRTRTIMSSSAPQWNEQYTWEVYDPCTVVTVGVFDNCHLQGPVSDDRKHDSKIGKIRIRLSTLESGKIYTYSYPLLVLQPHGLQKMGELQLAIRFSCTSLFNLLQVYSQPILPQMHYTNPLSVYQQDYLRHQATQLLASRLGRSEPPLRKEVVEYLLDFDSNVWCRRRTLANVQRIRAVFYSLNCLTKCVRVIINWQKPWLTVLMHLFLLILVFFPQLILPTLCFTFLFCGTWNYRFRPRQPPHMDPQMSCLEKLIPQDLDEEFDSRFQTTCNNKDALIFRYNRLRCVAGHVQTLLGDLASQLERLQSLLNWRDPRATALFVMFSFFAGIVLCFIPVRAYFVVLVIYLLRHPNFRTKLPPAPLNFFRRLPSKADYVI